VGARADARVERGARVASAPFTRELEWGCPMELESTASR
jgi:hypothetical protein